MHRIGELVPTRLGIPNPYQINMPEVTKSESKTNKNDSCAVRTLKELLPQLIACSVKNYTIFTAGISNQFPTIIIPALAAITINKNYEESLRITSEESSWFGSLTHICQLIGSILAGYVVDAFGRKRILLATSIPPILSFIMFYFSNSIVIVFVAYSIIGINNGVLQIAAVTYTGEICQPNIRAVMVCTATVSYTAGSFILYTLGSLTNWRLVSLISLIFPISSFFLVLQTPETPIWLLSRKQEDKARKSLQWLRGWVTPDQVENELQAMKKNLEKDKSSALSDSNKCIKIIDKLKNFTARSNLVPFFIANLLFVICHSNGSIAMTPFLVQILKAQGANVDANWSTVVIAAVSLVGTIACATCVKFLGKRKICLFGLVMCAISIGCLGFYALNELPKNWNSFENVQDVEIKSSWVPLVCIVGLFFFTSLSIADIPWMYMAELFPFRTRGFSTGMTMTIALLIGFINTKAYKDLEMGLSIGGTMLFFAAVTIVFIPLLYIFLPETEGISTEDIETFFSHENHKITDVDINSFLKKQNDKQIECTS